MPLLIAEASKLSNNDLQRGVIEEIIERDSVFNLLPFVKTNGKAYVYNREGATTSPGTFVATNEAITEGAQDYVEKVVSLKILAGDIDIDKFLEGTMSDTNAQMATQLALKAKSMGLLFQNKFINGDVGVDVKEFSGLKALAVANPAGQNLSAGTNGGALTLEMLDELVDMVPNGPDCLIMSPVMIRKYKSLLRQAGGNDAALLQFKNFTVPQLQHGGIPILMNSFVANNEVQGSSGATTSSVYAVRLNEQDGVHGIYGGDSAGIVVENIGTVQNKDAWRIRLKWYAAIVLKSTRSLARLKGVTAV